MTAHRTKAVQAETERADAMMSHGMTKEVENLMVLDDLILRRRFCAFPGSR
jgi:hypothetical protein